MSLLREIQNDLATPGGDLPSVLRKCKILAARLGSGEFAQWVDFELNGYLESSPIPEYRHLDSACYANFMNSGWQVPKQVVPWPVVPEKFRDSIRHCQFRKGIATVNSFISKGARIDQPELAVLIEGKIFPKMHCLGAWIEISGGAFEQLVSAVKNRILDFVLKIEAENPDAGEAPPNSQPVEMTKLQPLVHNVFYGAVGNVAQNSEHINQTTNITIKPQDLARLATELAEHLAELNLDPPQEKKARAQIATLKAQLTDEPDPIIVKQAGHTLRNITEGAIGSLLATAAQPTVWSWIQQIMANF